MLEMVFLVEPNGRRVRGKNVEIDSLDLLHDRRGEVFCQLV